MSNFGEIRNAKTKKVRKKVLTTTGYYSVVVSLGSRNSKKKFTIHKAVAETFIDNSLNLPFVNHKDCNKLNNLVDNLEWCTNEYNINHAKEHGRLKSFCGEDNKSSKLTWEQVCFIRENYKPYDSQYGSRGLAKKFNVDHSTILGVVNYKYWKIGDE